MAYLSDLSVRPNSNTLQQTETEVKPAALGQVPGEEPKWHFRGLAALLDFPCALFLITALAGLPKLIVLALNQMTGGKASCSSLITPATPVLFVFPGMPS